MARSAAKVFDILMPVGRQIETQWHFAPFHAFSLKDHDPIRMRSMYADAADLFKAAGVKPSDVSQRLLDMLENENYHQLYAMLEIYSGRKTLEDDIAEWTKMLNNTCRW